MCVRSVERQRVRCERTDASIGRMVHDKYVSYAYCDPRNADTRTSPALLPKLPGHRCMRVSCIHMMEHWRTNNKVPNDYNLAHHIHRTKIMMTPCHIRISALYATTYVFTFECETSNHMRTRFSSCLLCRVVITHVCIPQYVRPIN